MENKYKKMEYKNQKVGDIGKIGKDPSWKFESDNMQINKVDDNGFIR